MNLECQVCTGNKIATSFHSLDDLQAHLLRNHHDGPLEVFQFVCHNCEFKFGTEYRLLRHEEKCGRECRSEEDMEKIHYKLQMYELLEESLKFNMTKHQTYSVPPVNPPNIETSETRESPQTQCQTESLGAKSIKSELFESRENFVSNLRHENSNKNGSDEAAGASPSVIKNEPTKNLGNLRTVKAEVQDQNCSKNSATNTQSNVKTEPEDEDTSEVEVLGSVEIRKRKALSKHSEHITHRSGGIAQQNVNSMGESNMRQTKQTKTNLIAVSNKCRKSTVTFDNCNSVAKCIEQRTHKIQGRGFGLRAETPTQGMKDKIRANLPHRISETGPLLHRNFVVRKESLPTCMKKKKYKRFKRKLKTEFGAILRQNMPDPSSENKLKRKKKLRASQNVPGPSSGNVSAANVPSDQPAGSNLGSQMPQATASSSSQVHRSVIDCSLISKEWSQSRGLASSDKPGYK